MSLAWLLIDRLIPELKMLVVADLESVIDNGVAMPQVTQTVTVLFMDLCLSKEQLLHAQSYYFICNTILQ